MSGAASPAAAPEGAPDTDWRRRAKVLCVAGIGAKAVLSLATLPLTPSLLGTHPVALEAIRGTTSAMATGGAFARVGQASLALALLAPIPTLFFVIPLYWWAGRLWGPEVAGTLTGEHPKAARWAERTSVQLRRYGGVTVALAFYLPIPSALIYAAAGWTGMSLRRFVCFSLLGTISWVGLIVGLGYAVGHPAVRVAKTISHYALALTLALVVVTVVLSVIRGRSAPKFG